MGDRGKMPLEYEQYCDNCHQMQAWTSDEHNGKNCPSCGKMWIRPLPLPSRWLRDDIARWEAQNAKNARIINAVFIGVACVIGSFILALILRAC